MKIGVVFFHKNINNIYKKKWIEKCVKSIFEQTIKDFFVYEINYGGDDFSVLDEYIFQNKKFYNFKLKNHAEAMNFIITEAFNDSCDFVFNTNLDDFYEKTRFEDQLVFLKKGYDIVTSDFCYIKEDIFGHDEVVLHKNILQYGSIKYNLDNNHNIIAHPCVAYSKKFWLKNKYDANKIPKEDLLLWKKAINEGFKFFIHPKELLFYRIHDNQISANKI